MTCPYCETYGANTHSFFEIANTPKFGRIMYTCIAKATDYTNTKAITTHFSNTIKPTDKWTWIFDCRELKMKHVVQFDVATTLCKMIRDHFSDYLQRIIIVNPTPGIDTLVKHVLPIFSKDALQFLRKYKGSPLEILLELQKEGIEEDACKAIIQQLRAT
jgi:hypothetical protein